MAHSGERHARPEVAANPVGSPRGHAPHGGSVREFLSRGDVPLHIHIARESLAAVLGACLLSLAIVCGALGVAHLAAHVEFAGPVPMLVACCVACTLTLVLSMHWIMRSARRISEPAQQMVEATSAIADGDFSVRIDEGAFGLHIVEVNELVTAFNRMAAALQGMEYMRRDFTSGVSHELKTPIAAITGMCDLVSDPKLPDEERHEYLGLIQEQADRLSALCDSMLAMSRLDAQEFVTDSQRVDVDEQIRRDVIVLSERWHERDIALELDLDSLPIWTDPNLTHQIWINVIDNAYKYTPDGGVITLRSRTVPEGTVVTVSDTGRGMSPDEARHAFDRFYQADHSHSTDGSGLGLAIVRRVCELLGGSIACSSEKGRGTTMTIRLPRRTA